VLMVGCKETVRARAILLTHHQCITQFQSSCVTTVQESRDGRLQTTRDTPEGAQNPGTNETEFSSPFNRNRIQHFIANHFQLLDGKCNLFCGPAKYLRGPVPVRGPAVENH